MGKNERSFTVKIWPPEGTAGTNNGVLGRRPTGEAAPEGILVRSYSILFWIGTSLAPLTLLHPYSIALDWHVAGPPYYNGGSYKKGPPYCIRGGGLTLNFFCTLPHRDEMPF